MKQILISLLSGILFLTACGQTLPVTQTAPVPVVDRATSSPIPTNTNTPVPTETPAATITPLPTIPTFTPTFDARTIVTVMPAPKAECPKEDPSVVAKFATPNSNGSYEMYSSPDVLDYLNSGGTLDKLEKNPRGTGLEKIVDLTGDGLNEVVYRDLPGYAILGCKDGQYQDLFDFDGEFGTDLADVQDLNKDGIPELILYDVSHYGYAYMSVFEWTGNKFRSLINMGIDTSTGKVIDSVPATSPHILIDTNGDGLKEIIIVYNNKELCNGFSGLDFCDGTPARQQTTVLGWNGQNYVDLKQENYAPPEYRFQAIQDGDWYTRYGNYTKALSFYQEAIFYDQLTWWSPARSEYEINTRFAQAENIPTVYPTPILDKTEYPRLAAYAYYRIMILHLVQNHASDAGTVFKTLQQKFGNDPYGKPYTEMATAFWNAYQSTHKMYEGCAAAIQYAAEHPKILTPLGSDYHGSQSHTYVPADVCPFR